ncbi:hypothetical protein Lepto7375DRAFT_3825 [Leptolyngbya sp. PCC 7375]|nr:hypothetical protein Lepto7375DRAFT_3825 [Leptolyngbya sp. PCC 7375]
MQQKSIFAVADLKDESSVELSNSLNSTDGIMGKLSNAQSLKDSDILATASIPFTTKTDVCVDFLL